MSIPSYPFHSLLLKLPNKGMGFSFPPLKLPNKRREEYFKIIFFIPFHSIPFHSLPPNEPLSIWRWIDLAIWLKRVGSSIAQINKKYTINYAVKQLLKTIG